MRLDPERMTAARALRRLRELSGEPPSERRHREADAVVADLLHVRGLEDVATAWEGLRE